MIIAWVMLCYIYASLNATCVLHVNKFIVSKLTKKYKTLNKMTFVPYIHNMF